MESRDLTNYVWDIQSDGFFTIHIGNTIHHRVNDELTESIIPNKGELILLNEKKLKITKVEVVHPRDSAELGIPIGGIAVGVWCERI